MHPDWVGSDAASVWCPSEIAFHVSRAACSARGGDSDYLPASLVTLFVLSIDHLCFLYTNLRSLEAVCKNSR
jgi:hypothetical protein